MKMRLCIAMLASVLFGNASASVIYNEAAQGDLDWDYMGNPYVTLNLQVGTNIVLGSSLYTTDPNNGDSTSYDFDNFYFVLGQGQTLQSITYRVTHLTVTGNPTDLLVTQFGLFKAPDQWENPYAMNQFDVLSSDTQLLVGAESSISEAATYLVRNDSIGTNFYGGGIWDYELVLNVGSAIPEPPSFLIAGVGLLALIGVTRKRALRNPSCC